MAMRESTVSRQPSLQKSLESALKGANLSQSEELRRAKDHLAANINLPTDFAIRSFDRAADAIKNGIRVFISYKYHDREAAQKLHSLISDYGQSRLARNRDDQPYVIIGEQMEIGYEYPREIREEIEKAHWFFILIPDIESSLEWRIWEAGYFQRGMTASERLIEIRHNQATGAAPLQYLQACDSSPEGLQRLFSQLFFQDQAIPGMKQIAIDAKKQNLEKDTKELSKLFPPGGQPKPEFCGRFIEIKHTQGVAYDNIDDLLSAQIIALIELEEVFKRTNEFRGTFGELIESVNDDEHGRQWIEGLRGVLQDIVSEHPRPVVEIPFLGANEDWLFRPSVHCVWKVSPDNRVDRFHVIFIQEMGRRVRNVPADLDALETALRWAYRSWWEIYGTFGGRLSRQTVEAIYLYALRAEQESQLKGALRPEELIKVFKDPEAKEIERMFREHFTIYRNPIGQNGKLDRAFQNRDPELMQECLEELKPRSLWFLKVAARRFSELIDKI